MKHIRCPECGQLLLKADHVDGEIKCPRCKKTIKIKMESSKTEPMATLLPKK